MNYENLSSDDLPAALSLSHPRIFIMCSCSRNNNFEFAFLADDVVSKFLPIGSDRQTFNAVKRRTIFTYHIKFSTK